MLLLSKHEYKKQFAHLFSEKKNSCKSKFQSSPKKKLNTQEMNKTEARYEAEILAPLKQAGEILDYRFERVKLKLAKNTYYTFDFEIVKNDCTLECHEVKGFWRDDARVKIKVAAEMFPERKFIAVQLKDKKWEIEEIN